KTLRQRRRQRIDLATWFNLNPPQHRLHAFLNDGGQSLSVEMFEFFRMRRARYPNKTGAATGQRNLGERPVFGVELGGDVPVVPAVGEVKDQRRLSAGGPAYRNASSFT